MPLFRRGSTSVTLPPRGPSLVEIVRANGLGALPARQDLFVDEQNDERRGFESGGEGVASVGSAKGLFWKPPPHLFDVPAVCIEALMTSQGISCSVQHHPLWSLRDLGLSDSMRRLLADAGVRDAALWGMQSNATPLLLRGFNTLCAGPPRCGRTTAAMLAVAAIYSNSTHLREAPRVVFVAASDAQRRHITGFLRRILQEHDIEVSTVPGTDADVFILLPFLLEDLKLSSVDLLWIGRIDRFSKLPLSESLPALQRLIGVSNVVGASCGLTAAEAVEALVPRRVLCCQEGEDYVWFNVTHTVELCPDEAQKVRYVCDALGQDSGRLPCAVVVANKKMLDEAEQEFRVCGSAKSSSAPPLRVTRSMQDIARGDADVVLLSDWSAVAMESPRVLRHLINLSIPRRSAVEVLTSRVSEVFGSSARRHVCHVWTIMSSPAWTDRHASEVRQLLLETHQPIPMFLRKIS